MQINHPDRVRLGAFEFDLRAGEIRKGADKVLLPEQSFQILLMLVQRRGDLVTREEIKKKLWPNDTVVEFDHSIAAAIRRLRRALGDTADSPAYIETVASRGFRLLVRVEWQGDSSGDPAVIGSVKSSGDSFATEREAGPPLGDLPGKKVSHYRVLELVGGGGMGVVYKAEDLKLGRQVALKFLPPEVGSDPIALERFEREARAASALDHPNICSIYEFGEHEGQPFLVMPLLEGETLRERLASSVQTDAELLHFAMQITDGLEAAHGKGIIHRDIKPANIFITDRGEAKILDFGLAKLLNVEHELELSATVGDQKEMPWDGHTSLGLTRSGVALGTASYMSPEQVRGEKLDSRTDLFSFGLVLYEMAAGQQAFAGNTAAIVHDAILHQEPEPARQVNPKVPPRLETIIFKCLEKDREQRYQHAAEIMADLKRLSELIRAARRPWVTLASILVFVTVAPFVLWRMTHPQTAQPELKLQQLTFNSSENAVRDDSAISPDGKYLAYSDHRGSHIKDLEAGEVRDIALPQALKDNPTWGLIQWFPDGKRILSGVEEKLSVWTIPALGGTPRNIHENAFAWSISPDGSRIAFSTSEGGLWLMDVDGGNTRSLYPADENTWLDSVQWSPHGERLLYSRVDKMGARLESRDLKGGPPVKVLPDLRDGLMFYLWLPDGRLLYTVTERSSNEYTCNFWEVGIDERTGVMEGQPRRMTNWTGDLMGIGPGSVTADGKRLVFRRSTAQHSVFVADLKSNGTRISTLKQLTPTKNKNFLSSWTADSKAVIFSSRGGSGMGAFGIFKQSLDNDLAEPIVRSLPGYRTYEDSHDVTVPRASPDGRWILYTGRGELQPAINQNGFYAWTKLMRAPVSGGQPELVTNGNFYGPPSCANSPALLCAIAEQSEDHKQLIFTAVDAKNGRGRELKRIAIEPKGNYAWSLSPDGSRIALLNTLEGPIRIVSLSGKPEQQVSVRGWNKLDSVNWTAKGKALYVSGRTLRGSVLLYADLGGNSHVLWEQDGGWETYAIPSPDGRHLAIKSWTLDANIWMMENF